MSKLSDYKGEKIISNVVNLTNFNLILFSISLDYLCRKNGLTLDVWSQSDELMRHVGKGE